MWEYFGVICNTVTVLLGSTIGILLRKRSGAVKEGEGLPAVLMTALGFCTIFAAWSGMSAPESGTDALIAVVSMVLGVITGYALKLDDRINSLGDKIARGGKNTGHGFVTACLLFCTGSMTILGSFESAKNGGPVLDLNCHTTLLIKSLLDLVSSSCLATVYGISVLASAGFVLVFQGALVLLAGMVQPFLDSVGVMPALSAVGSMILLAIAVNLLGLKHIKTGDYLPALVYPVIICWILTLL